MDAPSTSSIVRRVESPHLAAALAPPVAPIVARVSINIRVATLADVGFIDGLQKAQTREVGFLPTKAIEGKIALGEVLIADCPLPIADLNSTQSEIGNGQSAIGYLIASDRYFKRDEIGCITQINVEPNYRRSLVAAALLQAQFDRSAYGCKLYCCWCAQDLKANEFWEAMGFVPIAFRTGSRTKGKSAAGKKAPRIHLFWQKRVRAGDVTTPWWYPSQTGGGEMREDRLVFPIPPGVSWRDVLPVVLADEGSGVGVQGSANAEKKPARVQKVLKAPRLKGGLWFAHEAIVEKVAPPEESALATAKPAIDPRLTKMARELRDRWAERAEMILPGDAKHDVRRLIAAEAGETLSQSHQLSASLTLPQAA